MKVIFNRIFNYSNIKKGRITGIDSSTILTDIKKIIDWENSTEYITKEADNGNTGSLSIILVDSETKVSEDCKNSDTLFFTIQYGGPGTSDSYIVDTSGIHLMSTTSGPGSLKRFLEAVEIIKEISEMPIPEHTELCKADVGDFNGWPLIWNLPGRLNNILSTGKSGRYYIVRGLVSESMLVPVDLAIDWNSGSIFASPEAYKVIPSYQYLAMEALRVFSEVV